MKCVKCMVLMACVGRICLCDKTDICVCMQKGVGRSGGPRTFFYTVTGDTNRRQPLMIYVTPVGFEPGPP